MIGTYLNTLLADAKNESLADVALFNPEEIIDRNHTDRA